MNRILILFSILIVTLLAFIDAKDRFNELNEVAANTPAQVEMKQSINQSGYKEKSNTSNNQSILNNDFNNDGQRLHQKIMKDNTHLQNKFNDIDKRRDSINKPY